MARVQEPESVVFVDDYSVNKNSTMNSTLQLGSDSGLASSQDLSNSASGGQPHVSVLSSISGLNVGRIGKWKVFNEFKILF